MSQNWINNALAALPGTDDLLFRKLWNERRLMFDGRQGVGDAVDEYGARLVAAALRRGERLLIVLPDFQPHRPAFLFATGLIRHLLDSRSVAASIVPQGGPVLYFGPTVGIRDQLRRTSVQGLRLSLAEVFSQQDVSRGAAGIGRSTGTERLPRVVTVFAPADPVAVVGAYRPCWIAVDCSDVSSLIWLRPLLEEAERQGIPVIAWGQNALSDCIGDFASNDQVFTWPPSIQLRGHLPRKLNGDAAALLYDQDSTCLSPFVLQGKSISTFSGALRGASQYLWRTVQHLEGRFPRDAVSVHWKFLRSLEALAVPVDFYEAEAPRFWGLQSFGKLQAACENFRAACLQSQRSLYVDLEEAGALLSKAIGTVQTQGCPLWDALSNLCIEEPADGEAQLLLFASDSRKLLFLFALLARHNITDDDLRELRTHVVSLAELRHWIHYRSMSSESPDDNFLMPPESLTWHPILVGLPSPSMTPRLLSALLHPRLDIVLYPHQCPAFISRQAQWSARLSGDTGRNVGTLARMSGLSAISTVPATPTRVSVEQPVELNVETTTKTRTTATGPVWQPEDTISEVARLFEPVEESAGEEPVLQDQEAIGSTPTTETSEDILCAEAIRVQFDQGWYVVFALDDMINVVQDGTLDPRYVRSLRVGERVLLIHGQQRQSLYDLIISRVHRHPSIQLHLAMIRRWQEDLRVAFQHWQSDAANPAELRERGVRDLSGLLRGIQARGSQLVSTLTLSFWLRGFVLCPLDPEDLRRVAEVLDMGFVRQYHGRIVKAANRLRGLHRGLSLKLNRWLESHATGEVHKSDDDVLDEELGLTFGDVRNSLLVLRVVAIQNIAGPFLRSNLVLLC